MTIEEAYKKITSSEELKKEAIEALKSGKGDEFLKKQGIDLTLEQIKEHVQKSNGELNKEELDMATGGCSFQTCSDLKWSFGTWGIGCAISAAINESHNASC